MRALPTTMAMMLLALCAAVFLSAPVQAEPATQVNADKESERFDARPQLTSARQVLQSTPDLPTPKQTQAELKAILAQPEYSAQSTPAGDSWLVKFLEWLQRVLSGLGLKAPTWWGWVLLVALATGVIYLITRVIWEWMARRSRKTSMEDSAAEESLDAAALLKAAQAAADRGDFRLAIRLRFKWLLTALELGESALLTNRQLVSRLAKERPALREPLKQLVICFEDAWYGGLPCGVDDLAQAVRLAESVHDRVRQEAA
jgi:hypothetical protein